MNLIVSSSVPIIKMIVIKSVFLLVVDSWNVMSVTVVLITVNIMFTKFFNLRKQIRSLRSTYITF